MAFGLGADGGTVWRSADGRAWEQVARLDGSGALTAATDGEHLVAYDGLHIWWTTDGRRWSSELVEAPGVPTQEDLRYYEASIDDIAVVDGRVILTGWVGKPNTPAWHAAAWVRGTSLPP